MKTKNAAEAILADELGDAMRNPTRFNAQKDGLTESIDAKYVFITPNTLHLLKEGTIRDTKKNLLSGKKKLRMKIINGNRCRRECVHAKK